MKKKLFIIFLALMLSVDVNARFDYQVEEPDENLGQQIADYAIQFEGNPYVWSGTSLTNGADCSGFAFAVMKYFDIDIPRVSNDQFCSGEVVDVDDRQPGDLMFYGYGNTYSDHTAIYIGNDEIIHAKNSAEGIVISDYDYWNLIGVRRYWGAG